MANVPTTVRFKNEKTRARLAKFAGSNPGAADLIEFAVEELFRQLDEGAEMRVRSDGGGYYLHRSTATPETRLAELPGSGAKAIGIDAVDTAPTSQSPTSKTLRKNRSG